MRLPAAVHGALTLCLLLVLVAGCSPGAGSVDAGDPAPTPGAAHETCRVAGGSRVHQQFGFAFGPGPVHVVLGTHGTDPVLVIDADALEVGGMRVAKLMWVAEPSFTGEATVRASRPDGGAFLLDLDGAADPAERPVDAFDSEVTLTADSAGSAADGWLVWPSAGAFSGPGCHTLWVEAGGEHWEIHFEAVFD